LIAVFNILPFLQKDNILLHKLAFAIQTQNSD